MARQAQTSVMGDLIPYDAGIVILTPLDKNGRKENDKAVFTGKDFIQTTQTVESITMETLPNGRGDDKDFQTKHQYTLTIVTGIYDLRFHAMAANRIVSAVSAGSTTDLQGVEVEITPIKVGSTAPYTYEVAFGTSAAGGVADTPAADADGVYDLKVQDTYGNFLENGGAAVTTLEAGVFKYNSGTKIMSFSSDYKGIPLRCIFFKVPTYGGAKIVNDPVLKSKQFHVKVLGEVKSAATEDVYPLETLLKKCTYAADVSDPMGQRSINGTCTYVFKSAPVANGVSVYEQFVPALTTARV